MLRLSVQGFSSAKAGNRPQEYEDAWAYDQETKRLAIADGASDASFESRLWAQALVTAFSRQPPTPDVESMLEWLRSPIHLWREGIRWKDLDVYAEEKARRGSFSTLLGVTFTWPTPDPGAATVVSGKWQALAVGDSCLFQVRGGDVVVRFPIERVADFGTTPPLLSTLPDYNRRHLEELKTYVGECQSGDLVVLATDALACWFLQQLEDGKQPWQSLINLSREEFIPLIEQLRQDKAMRNDDVTLLLVWIGEREIGGAPAQQDVPHMAED